MPSETIDIVAPYGTYPGMQEAEQNNPLFPLLLPLRHSNLSANGSCNMGSASNSLQMEENSHRTSFLHKDLINATCTHGKLPPLGEDVSSKYSQKLNASL